MGQLHAWCCLIHLDRKTVLPDVLHVQMRQRNPDNTLRVSFARFCSYLTFTECVVLADCGNPQSALHMLVHDRIVLHWVRHGLRWRFLFGGSHSETSIQSLVTSSEWRYARDHYDNTIAVDPAVSRLVTVFDQESHPGGESSLRFYCVLWLWNRQAPVHSKTVALHQVVCPLGEDITTGGSLQTCDKRESKIIITYSGEDTQSGRLLIFGPLFVQFYIHNSTRALRPKGLRALRRGPRRRAQQNPLDCV